MKYVLSSDSLRSVAVLFVILFSGILSNAQTRWEIQPDGSIIWNIDNRLPHFDHVEMSGEQMSVILRYGVNADGAFAAERMVIWPMLRTIPNDTHASLRQRFSIDYPSLLIVNGFSLQQERVKSIQLDGKVTVSSEYCLGLAVNTGAKQIIDTKPAVEITRIFYPSTDKPLLGETYVVKNISSERQTVLVPNERTVYQTDPQKGVDGSYTMIAKIQEGDAGLFFLEPQETLTFSASVQAYKKGQSELNPLMREERLARERFVNEMWSKLVFNSPDPVLNTAFAFAKIRACESIFKTAGGYMHGPGGDNFYAAIWANDQGEYMNPLFPFIGYDLGNESAINSFRHFARFMNDEYKSIPSSIIAEGKDIWNGAGDRGDNAMLAYGATRYALAFGDKKEAEELWPLIEWCLEYCRRHLNDGGVVMSDSDELENRFPSGDANLFTSILYYDALISAEYLAKEIGKPGRVSQTYGKEAARMRKAIADYFGTTVEGFETYRYYDGNEVLRAWICLPLTVGIYDRKAGTIDALFSPRLWTKNGLLTEAGSETFWDRATLYALRGIYAVGERDKATEYLKRFSAERLLGEHVPYAIEAWPEGNQRHLSAESGLYCRIFTEGLFGIRPVGFNSFTLAPQLPDGWDFMELKNVHAFKNEPFDIRVEREDSKIRTIISRNGNVVKTVKTKVGDTFAVTL